MSAVAIANPPRKNSLPALIDQNGVQAPEAPRDPNATGIDRGFLADLALKAAHALPQCTTRWLSNHLCMPQALVEELLQQMARDHLLEVLGLEGPFNHRYAVSGRGHERAQRLIDISSYAGPAPVSLETYAEMIHFQHSQFPDVTLEDVRDSLADLVLPPEDVMTAALAAMSQRSLFVFGPPGNGKTTLARLLHNVCESSLWIPYAIAVGTDVIRIFDPQIHQQVDFTPAQAWKVDQRWVRIRRPFLVAGGEMTIDSLELSYGPRRGFYEAPLHMKSNGGTFVIDDLGRQRVAPVDLLNRWIIPLENGFDFFTLQCGAKIRVPFQQMLIVATNLEPEKVMDPAFMRRMGYRIHLTTPTPERYQEIFHQYAARWQTSVPPGLVERLLERYRRENRELRGCEPRDLLGRVQDINRLLRQPMQLNDDVLDLAWASYFGAKQAAS
jgi:hypothetical protein